MLKVIHVPFCFYPDPVGGTEIYVESLSQTLQARGHTVIVAAPGMETAAYSHGMLSVRRFPVGNLSDLRDLYGPGDEVAARAFGRILDEESPDLVHLHAFTSAVSVRLVEQSKQRGIPVVFTYHTPTVSCLRGTLMRWGSEVCDGRIDRDRCTPCTLHGLNMEAGLARLVGRMPVAAGQALGNLGKSGGPWTALRMRELVALREASFHTLMNQVDHVIAIRSWVRDLLVRNGVPAAKISLSPHGILETASETNSDLESPPRGKSLRVAYLGRFNTEKGPDLLVRAVRQQPTLPLELHLYGITQDGAGATYAAHLRHIAADDPRISFRPTVPNRSVVGLLKAYDVLAVPSRWLETGPLVVLEAFAAGVPVIGSNLGGIAELVTHEVDGLLVEPDSANAWTEVLLRLARESNLLQRLKAGVRPPRSIEMVAEETLAVYDMVVQAVLR